VQTPRSLATPDRLEYGGKWLWLMLTLLVAPARAWGVLPTECSCVDSSGTAQSPCTASTVAVRCLYTSTQAGLSPVSLTTLRLDVNYTLAQHNVSKEIDFDSSPVVIEAGGARGGKGEDSCFLVDCWDGGSGGSGGYARTTQRYEDLPPDLYVYIGSDGPRGGGGGKGGSSSVVIGQLLTEVSDPLAPETEGVFAIAGSGGGGGESNCFVTGGYGGTGGCAIATLTTSGSNCTFATNGANASAAGDNGKYANSDKGQGGNRDGYGGGGGQDEDVASTAGASGVGGLGGPTTDSGGWVGWNDSDLDLDDWPYGAGGLGVKPGSDNAGGGGGGGFGGGAGGDRDACSGGGADGSGGGGGGSWARGATGNETAVPVVDRSSLGTKVALTFGLESTLAEKAGLPLVLLSRTGKVTQLGTEFAKGTLRLRATYALDGLPFDLSKATLYLGRLLGERGQELVEDLPPGLLPPLRGASVRSARFAASAGAPVRVKLEKKDEGQTLALLLETDQARILSPQQCAAQPWAGPHTGLLSWLVVEDGTHKLVLEVADHWACRMQQDGKIRELQLGE
jgi:hypothetical protein